MSDIPAVDRLMPTWRCPDQTRLRPRRRYPRLRREDDPGWVQPGSHEGMTSATPPCGLRPSWPLAPVRLEVDLHRTCPDHLRASDPVESRRGAVLGGCPGSLSLRGAARLARRSRLSPGSSPVAPGRPRAVRRPMGRPAPATDLVLAAGRLRGRDRSGPLARADRGGGSRRCCWIRGMVDQRASGALGLCDSSCLLCVPVARRPGSGRGTPRHPASDAQLRPGVGGEPTAQPSPADFCVRRAGGCRCSIGVPGEAKLA